MKPFQVSITEWSSQSKLHEQKWILLCRCPWFLVGQKTMLIKTDFHDTQMRFVVIKQELRTYWTPVYSHTWLIAERFTTILMISFFLEFTIKVPKTLNALNTNDTKTKSIKRSFHYFCKSRAQTEGFMGSSPLLTIKRGIWNRTLLFTDVRIMCRVYTSSLKPPRHI